MENRFCLLLLVLVLTSCNVSNNLIVGEPYHGPPYHSATQLDPPYGVRKVSTEEVLMLHQSKGAIFIDVMGAIFREESLDFDGEWLINKPRADIPGSIWLANSGEAKLTPIIERYYRENLQRLTAGDKGVTLLFYCIEDCWMSWNASKRAVEWGYRSVLWYRKGVDGWKDAGLPLEERFPVPLPTN